MLYHTDIHIAKYMPRIFRSYLSTHTNVLQCLLINDIASTIQWPRLHDVQACLSRSLFKQAFSTDGGFQVNKAPPFSTFFPCPFPTCCLPHSTQLLTFLPFLSSPFVRFPLTSHVSASRRQFISDLNFSHIYKSIKK